MNIVEVNLAQVYLNDLSEAKTLCFISRLNTVRMIYYWPVSKLVAVPVCWFPREVGSVCDKCTEGRVLLQYASNSSSPRPCAPSGHWSPREAEGIVR